MRGKSFGLGLHSSTFGFCFTAILVLYLIDWLGFDRDAATAIYHVFIVLCYFSPTLGAILADGFIGKYK
jgi:dipeptide/tripeptide permease